MQTKTWKKDRDLLEEAYGSINETTHSPENSCKDDEYYCKVDKVCKKKDDRKAAGQEKVNENSLDEIDDMMPDEAPAMEREPDEVDSEIESLKNLILNPPADKIEEYAQQGQLHVYVDMLKKKLEAAEAVKAAVRGESE